MSAREDLIAWRRKIDDSHATAVSSLRQLDNALRAASEAFDGISPTIPGLLASARKDTDMAIELIEGVQRASAGAEEQ